MVPTPHPRIVYADMARLRADAIDLLERNAYEVAWDHIHARAHHISEDEVRAAFYFGTYAPSGRIEGRYLASFEDAELGETFHVVFELQRVPGGRFLLVVTAYQEGGM